MLVYDYHVQNRKPSVLGDGKAFLVTQFYLRVNAGVAEMAGFPFPLETILKPNMAHLSCCSA